MPLLAEVAEMADALRSGRSGRKAVGVQLPASALPGNLPRRESVEHNVAGAASPVGWPVSLRPGGFWNGTSGAGRAPLGSLLAEFAPIPSLSRPRRAERPEN